MLKTSPPNLFEVHKTARRARILAAARKLIARRGFEGLTLRDLAAASEVSVPTVYNLIGGKQAVLVALLDEMLARIAARLGDARAGGMVERALALCEAGWSETLAEPNYFRGLMHAFLVSEETAPLRREIDERNIALMAGVLGAGKADGELASWADPLTLSYTMYSSYIATMLRWCGGELDDAALPAAISYGLALILGGVARGDAVRKLERLARANQSAATPPLAAAARHSKKGARS
jgi:AcrR family transcriptional regulator